MITCYMWNCHDSDKNGKISGKCRNAMQWKWFWSILKGEKKQNSLETCKETAHMQKKHSITHFEEGKEKTAYEMGGLLTHHR